VLQPGEYNWGLNTAAISYNCKESLIVIQNPPKNPYLRQNLFTSSLNHSRFSYFFE